MGKNVCANLRVQYEKLEFYPNFALSNKDVCNLDKYVAVLYKPGLRELREGVNIRLNSVNVWYIVN